MYPWGYMAPIAQRRNDTKPHHDRGQDDPRSVSRPTNSSMASTKRFVSSGRLNSHTYDVGDTPRLIQRNETLDHTNHIGVHFNA
jgi:hypothetical protein